MEICEKRKKQQHPLKARLASQFDELLAEMDELLINEELVVKARNRFDTQQLKRLLQKQTSDKWFDVYGRTEKDGCYYMCITRTQ